ncbi:glycosyltransferase family 2 protein [Flavihumibacter fluvii]|uniref:glycosyltransferase family 2 protein n=1 Tax=Flavihumibacter fluvii TaxID=2838157 RepID=UPI001BDF0FA0|nr:glycosyltransferase family 2 protein [Flavihumibacter fluvii]ULQ52397.1 glycosyltransferase [Flavihumibacter fluvii]
MNAPPLVSVLMTSYNREKYITNAIQSVLDSDFTDYELIIVDDISKDNTFAIAKEFEKVDSRVKVFQNAKNLGDYPNRNCAASYAKGKYLKYVDADDLIYPWGLGLLVKMMELFPNAGYGLCSLKQDDNRIYPFELSPSEAYKYNYKGSGIFNKAPLSSIILREAYLKVGGFREIRMAGDFDMWHRLSQIYPVVLMPQGIVWYRKHSEQEMNSHKNYVQVYEGLKIGYLKSDLCPLDKEFISQILKKNKRHIQRKLALDLIKLRWSDFSIGVKKLKQY